MQLGKIEDKQADALALVAISMFLFAAMFVFTVWLYRQTLLK